MKHIHIHLNTAKTEDSRVAVPRSMVYWHELWDQYTVDFVSVEIHCWKEEKEKIDELMPLASFYAEQGLIMSITLSLDESNRAYLRNHSIDPEGGLKWFSLYFYKENIQMLEIAQYGTEIVLYGVTKDEADDFAKIFPDIDKAEYFKEHLM